MKDPNKKSTKKAVKVIALVLCAVIIAGFISYDIYISSVKEEKTFFSMGTLVTVKLGGKNASPCAEEIQNAIDGIDSSYLSRREEGSDVERINASAGSDVSVSRETAAWISKALDICSASGGKFDITLGKISELWNIDNGGGKVPDESDIDSLLEKVGYSRVLVNETSVKCGEGQSIDLGSVGKGIACDVTKDILKSGNVKSAVVSVGGSVLVYGKSATVGITDPYDTSSYMAVLKLKDKFISTSGDYEKYFEQDGKRYHHIIDPSTGYPSEGDLTSVTVISNSGLESDALSTACFVLGYKKSLGLLNQYNAEAVFIFKDKTVAVTDGIKKSFEIKNSDYTVK